MTTYLPADNCLLCDKPLNEIGGRMIISQRLRGISLSSKYLGGGNKDYPYQSIKLYDEGNLYVTVWGDKSIWTVDIINKAKSEFLNKKHPWFCQVCGQRVCNKCGQSINYPAGSDIISEDGSFSHCAMLPINLGCINVSCENYRLISYAEVNSIY